ncbi:MAG: hypothetical protein Q7T81_02635 [Pseudolabrys sp.]|nr:hypothetical protein [Pseudolabrys sp.]
MNKVQRAMLSDALDRMKLKHAEMAELVVDGLAEHLTESMRQVDTRPQKQEATAARRQIANVLHTSAFCERKACRRSHCCRGEPLHCLQTVMPILPPDAFAGLLRKKRNGTRAPVPRMRRSTSACEVVRR